MATGALRVISVDQLIDDPDVQLAFAYDERRVASIASHWDDDMVSVLAVVPLNGKHTGKFGVIDGRHRLGAAKLRGVPKELRCDVRAAGLTPSQKAAIKLGLDRNRRLVKAIESFLVEVIMGEPTACDIKRIAEGHCFEVGPQSGGKPYNRIAAVMTLREIYKRGPEQLSRALALATLWRDEPKVTHNHWLGGCGEFVRSGWDNQLSPSGYERLRDLVPGKVIKEAMGLSVGYVSSSRSGGEVSRLIADRLRKTARIRAQG